MVEVREVQEVQVVQVVHGVEDHGMGVVGSFLEVLGDMEDMVHHREVHLVDRQRQVDQLQVLRSSPLSFQCQVHNYHCLMLLLLVEGFQVEV